MLSERGEWGPIVSQLTSSAVSKLLIWCVWGTPGVSNMRHLPCMTPSTLSKPAGIAYVKTQLKDQANVNSYALETQAKPTSQAYF